MTKRPIIDNHAAAAGIAVLIGFVGLMFVFTDPVEGWPLRIAIATTFFFLSGAAIGFIHPNGWPMAMLTAWGGALMGGLITLVAISRNDSSPAPEPLELPIGLIMLFGSPIVTLFGGFLGKSFSRKGTSVPPR